MMRKAFIGVIAVVVSLAATCDHGWVIQAQTLPYQLQVTWPANPASDNVTAYGLQVDSGTVVSILPTACTGTPLSCVGTVPVLTAGAHTLTQTAQNQILSSTVPVTVVIQTSPPTTTAFTVNIVASKPAGPTALK